MIPMSEDFFIDLSTSCTKEQAVLRLLGWGKETISKKYIEMNHRGDVVTDMKEISPKAIDLHKLLTETYQEALQRFEDALPKNPTEEEMDKLLDEHGPRIEEAEGFVKQAHGYLMDITDELAKPDSLLRIDQDATARVGSTCITIRSLEEWKTIKYSQPDEKISKAEAHSRGVSEVDPKEDPQDHPAKYRNLLVTFALAIKAFTKYDSSLIYNDSLNVQETAKQLCDIGHAMTTKGNDDLRFQSIAAIKDRINAAQKALKLIIVSS